MVLYKKLFEEEFDIEVLQQAGVIKTHFMLHTSMKGEIQKSWETKKWGLIRSMLGFGSLLHHIEPILLIADYYGEKHAMYFTFLIHHIAMLFIPSVFGMVLWGYHIYLATQYVPPPEEEIESNFVISYFAILDTKFNYIFLFILATWSSVYIESWKRK